MLKKLKRRYVTISMLIISGVLAVFYIVSGSAFLMSITLDMKSVLQTYTAAEDITVAPEIGKGNENDSLFALHAANICVVETKEMGNITILEFGRANMDESIVSRAVERVLRSEADFGHVNEFNLFYHRNELTDGSRIAFADSTLYFSYLKVILVDGAVFMLLATIFLWLIMRFLAAMSLKPVERAWAQQKNFIADASHELKTPLTVILTNNGILQSHKADTVESQLQWVNSTYEEAVHMRDLVEKLLMLAKTDDAAMKKQYSDVNLSDVAMQLGLQFEPVAFEKGVYLSCDIDKSIHINGDIVALRQIVHILLDNAVKYADVGGEVSLTLKRRRVYRLRKGIGYNIYLSAKNTGTPIPEEDIPHIFERFYRSDKARTSGSGYGLGLSICKNLALLHGGDISVTSDIENGTVFTVVFRQ